MQFSEVNNYALIQFLYRSLHIVVDDLWTYLMFLQGFRLEWQKVLNEEGKTMAIISAVLGHESYHTIKDYVICLFSPIPSHIGTWSPELLDYPAGYMQGYVVLNAMLPNCQL